MSDVRKKLLDAQAQFRQHPFFAEITLESLKSFGPRMSFWVLTFQDLLLFNEARVKDPKLRKIATHHRREDVGHERWFLDDLQALGLGPLGVTELFASADAPIREATFRIVSQALYASSDLMRVLLLLALESAGHVFFAEVAKALPTTAGAPKLRYFSDFHLQVEKGHEVFEKRTEELVYTTLTQADFPEASRLIDEVFAAFTSMMDTLRAKPVAKKS